MGHKIKKIEEWGEVTVTVTLGDTPNDVDYDTFNDALKGFYCEKLDKNIFDSFNEYEVDENEYMDGKAVFRFYEFQTMQYIDALVDLLNKITPDFCRKEWAI